MKIDEDANIGGESKFEKNGWTYTYAPWMDDEQQYSRYKFVNSNVKSENLSKETYYAEKGNLDDNPFSVKQISFEEAKEIFIRKDFSLVLLGSGIQEESENNLCTFFNKQNPNIIIVQHYGGGSGLLKREILLALENNKN